MISTVTPLRADKV